MTRGIWGQGELRFDQWHHAYLGAALIAFGVWQGHHPSETIGWIVLVDDLLQHFIQWRWVDNYHSPLKWLFIKWIWEPWLRR